MSYFFNYLPTTETKTFNLFYIRNMEIVCMQRISSRVTDTRAPAERFHGKCFICFKRSLVISEDKTSQ